MLHGLTANGVPVAKATTLAHLPAVSYLFAAFLGYNPIGSLLGAKVLSSLSGRLPKFVDGFVGHAAS